MRGSDVVDIAAEVAPRWLSRALAMAVLVWILVTGNAAPIMWYAQDKAAGITDAILAPLVDHLTAPLKPAEVQPSDHS